MRRTLALSLTVLIFTAANAFAGAEARMTGKVIDGSTKEPIANATFKLEATEAKTLKQNVPLKKDGTFAVFLLDGTIKYKFTVAAPGYQPYEEVIKLKIGDTTKRDFELFKAGAGPAGAVKPGAEPAKADPSVSAYNEGAALANAGDLAGAAAKFEEALATKPDLTAGWIALAKIQLKLKNYPKAIDAAQKVLEIDNEDTEMWAVLHQSYTATGNKAKAAEAEAKLPKNAGLLFNEAARLINAGKDADAEPLLKQAVSLDDKMAMAYYELGMVCVRSGKSADAKANLTKYLELDPTGKDAATAKEMLKYLP